MVSRALKVEINRFIHGCVNIYVDDLLGVSLRRHLESDIATAKSICCRLFNSECLEDSKTVSGRVLTVIGYTINLDSMMVSVAQKNYLRVIYGLSTITFEEKIPIKTLQKFASWISRYASIFTFLKPLSKECIQLVCRLYE